MISGPRLRYVTWAVEESRVRCGRAVLLSGLKCAPDLSRDLALYTEILLSLSTSVTYEVFFSASVSSRNCPLRTFLPCSGLPSARNDLHHECCQKNTQGFTCTPYDKRSSGAQSQTGAAASGTACHRSRKRICSFFSALCAYPMTSVHDAHECSLSGVPRRRGVNLVICTRRSTKSSYLNFPHEARRNPGCRPPGRSAAVPYLTGR